MAIRIEDDVCCAGDGDQQKRRLALHSTHMSQQTSPEHTDHSETRSCVCFYLGMQRAALPRLLYGKWIFPQCTVHTAPLIQQRITPVKYFKSMIKGGQTASASACGH